MQAIITAVHNWCRQQPIKLCVLFGSQATGQTHSGSDIDLAIWPDIAPTAADKLRWVRELQTVLDSEVSLVIVSAALDPVLGWEIAKNGRLIYEQSDGLWLHHRAQRWHAYNDSLPFLRAARRQLRQFAAEVADGP